MVTLGPGVATARRPEHILHVWKPWDGGHSRYKHGLPAMGNVDVLEDHAIECDATLDLSYETGIANRLHKKGSVGRQALSLVLV